MMPEHKLKVFLSSASKSEQENYLIARAALKALIESTQIAKVYLFEGAGASTISAGKHYLGDLQDCDVCIFFIDNADGVPNGVQVEIDCANKYHKKSLYYFCDKNLKEVTPLQKSLMGFNHCKSKVVHSFEEFIINGAKDLVDDILLVYREYCKGRISYIDDVIPIENDYQDLDASFTSLLLTNKNIIENIDSCKMYFSEMFGFKINGSSKTNYLDQLCSKFLGVLFENTEVNSFDFEELLRVLNSLQNSQYHAVISIRWKSIELYFQGNIVESIVSLKEALKLSKLNKLPDWIIKDILIDIRNLEMRITENSIIFGSEIQEEISNSDFPVHYPLLDRYNEEMYEKCIKLFYKEKTTSPNTVTFYSGVNEYTNLIANQYIIAMFNGSLTQLLMLYRRILHASFSLSEKFTDWNFKITMLKMAIIDSGDKDVSKIIESYSEYLCKIDANDALSIYKFSNNNPIKYRQLINNIVAFKTVGYFLDDENFSIIFNSLRERYDREVDLNSKDNSYLVTLLFSMFTDLCYRIDHDIMAEFCIKIFNMKYESVYDKMFEFIGDSLDINVISLENSLVLMKEIEKLILSDIEIHSYRGALERMVCSLRKKCKSRTENVNEAIRLKMNTFYEDIYLLETTDNYIENMPRFIKKYTEIIKERNETQGKNGVYHGYMDRPHITLKEIIKQSKIEFEVELIIDVFEASSETLINTNQDIMTKCDAYELNIYLINKYYDITSQSCFFTKLKNVSGYSESASSMLSNLNENVLKYSNQLMLSCMGENIVPNIVELSPNIESDLSSEITASKMVSIYLENRNQASENTDLDLILLQQTIRWSNSSNTTVRWYAIRSLFYLLKQEKYTGVISNCLVRLMDSDNVFIKNSILRHFDILCKYDIKTSEYILQKATLDTNFLVRKIASEVTNISI